MKRSLQVFRPKNRKKERIRASNHNVRNPEKERNRPKFGKYIRMRNQKTTRGEHYRAMPAAIIS
jgi:hypothetical protein